MQTEPRLMHLQLCALLENSLNDTEVYINRYEKLTTSTGLKRINDVLDKLRYANQLFLRLYVLLCRENELSYSSTLKAYNILRENYDRLVILEPPLPGAVKQMYYEIFLVVKRILEG